MQQCRRQQEPTEGRRYAPSCRNLRPSGRGGCQHHFPIRDAEKIGTGEDCRPDRRRQAGWFGSGQRSPARKRSRSTGASQPGRRRMRSFMPPSRARRRPRGGGAIWATGFPWPGDDHFFTGLHGPDDLRQPVLGFGDADVHVLNYSYFLWLFRPVPARHPGLRHYAQRESKVLLFRLVE